MYVCLYVCMYVCMFVCMYVSMVCLSVTGLGLKYTGLHIVYVPLMIEFEKSEDRRRCQNKYRDIEDSYLANCSTKGLKQHNHDRRRVVNISTRAIYLAH